MNDNSALKVADTIAEIHRLVIDAKSKVSAAKQPEVWGPLDHADALLQGVSVPFMSLRANRPPSDPEVTGSPAVDGLTSG